jgi:hypothetical protein
MYKFSISRRTAVSTTRAALIAASLVTLSASSAFAQEAKSTTAATPPAVSPKIAEAPKTETGAQNTGDKAEKTPESTDAGQADAPVPPTEVEIEAARVSFEAGTKAFEEGRFSDALAEFEKAHATIPSPHAEYWLAASKDNADVESKNTRDVVAAYERFLSNTGKSHVGADKVTTAEKRVAELKALLPAVITFVTQPEGAVVTIDGTRQESVTPLKVELTSGAHKVGVSLDGHEPASLEINAEGGSTVEQQITLTAEPPPAVVAPVVAETPPAGSSIVPAAVTLGIAGASLITGTLFGIMALNSKSKFNENPNTEDADAAERNALIADMSFGIAITLGVTGIVLLTADEESEGPTQAQLKREPTFVVAPYGGPTGGGAAAQLKF